MVKCILKNLQSRRDHPTADMVYESVRMEQPNISLGTVYRNLAFLSENGQILKISTGTGPDHFDGCTNPHVHFVCRSCGKVIDMRFRQIVVRALVDLLFFPFHFLHQIERSF